MSRLSKHQLASLKTVVFFVCLVPFAFITWDAVNGLLGADPIQTLHFRTGDWTLRFIFVTLSMTPLQRLFSSPLPIRFRRMFGLFTFYYATMHLMVWLVLDQSLSLNNMREDVPQSPYIILGLVSYSLLLMLAATSTSGMMRRMGSAWFTLHKLIYLIAIMGVVHFFWLTKLDYSEPLIYAAILVVLLAFRWQAIRAMLAFKTKDASA